LDFVWLRLPVWLICYVVDVYVGLRLRYVVGYTLFALRLRLVVVVGTVLHVTFTLRLLRYVVVDVGDLLRCCCC